MVRRNEKKLRKEMYEIPEPYVGYNEDIDKLFSCEMLTHKEDNVMSAIMKLIIPALLCWGVIFLLVWVVLGLISLIF